MIKKDDYELYFLNDSYDDEIISDAICSFRNRLYYDILSGKKYIQNNTLRNGDLNDVVIDKKLNRKYGMPDDSYSLHLNIPIIQFYSTQEFITNYEYDKPISLSTIIKDNETFTKNIFFYIGNYLIYDAYVVLERTCDSSIIFIPTGDTYGINSEFLNELISNEESDNMWTINLVEKSDIYYSYSTRSSLINGNKIYVSNMTQISKYNKPSPSNSWSIFITYNNRSMNIMTSSYVSMNSDENGYYFLLRDEFVEFIYQNATMMKCIIVNNPSCIGNGIYVNTNSTDPIFQIPYKKNPIPLENIVVWKFDSATQRKLHPLETTAEMSYPNIYNFKDMIDAGYFRTLYTNSKSLIILSTNEIVTLGKGSDGDKVYDLYIEWIEPVDDPSAFDTYISPYINCYGDEYVTMLKNNTVHSLVKNYAPIQPIDFAPLAYFNSDYKGDYRAWRLDKIIRLSKDNPLRYEELFNKIYQKRKKLVSKSYSYASNKHIYERSIMDNKFHCDSSEENYMTFTEPQSFIRVYNASCTEKCCSLYINGVMKKITAIMSFGSLLYIYFPTSYVTNKEDIHLDIYLDDIDIESHWIYLNRFKDSFDFEEHPFIFDNSLSNLLFINDETGEYLSKEDLNIELQLTIAEIQYIGLDKVDTISALVNETELWDSLMSLVVPTDHDVIILKTSEIMHTIENYNSQKKIDLNNIVLSLKNKQLADKKLGIYTSNFRFVRYFKDTIDDEIVINNFIGKPDASRFNVFRNGILINPALYQVLFTTYNGDVTIKFNTSILSGDICVEYTGFDRDLIFDGTYGELNNMNDNILYLDNFLDTPFDNLVYQIYIDGYRIHNNDIKFISQHSMIKINNSLNFTNESEVIILKQRMDNDPYEYDTSLEFLSDVSKDDNVFRQYLLDTYDN